MDVEEQGRKEAEERGRKRGVPFSLSPFFPFSPTSPGMWCPHLKLSQTKNRQTECSVWRLPFRV
jgi:hypothetical protein